MAKWAILGDAIRPDDRGKSLGEQKKSPATAEDFIVMSVKIFTITYLSPGMGKTDKVLIAPGYWFQDACLLHAE